MGVKLDGVAFLRAHEGWRAPSAEKAQHTLEVVMDWLDSVGLELVSTNLNDYEPPNDRSALIRAERNMEALSWQHNRDERRYFPGFFTVLAQRPEP